MILDTNAVSSLLAGDPDLNELLGQDERHQLPVIVIGEYRYGLKRSSQAQKLEALLDLLIANSDVLSISETTARHYASVREGLRRGGRPIPENDVWIAAIAVKESLPVVSRDKHFSHVAGLVVRAW